jgi:RNA polymerase sigma-70 factor (ECF subfamily)
VLRFAYSYLKNQSDAEDIAQEVFVTFMQKSPAFENEAKKKSWLMTVTSNKCKDFLKSGWKKKTVAMPDNLSYMPADKFDLLSYVLSLEDKYRVPIHLFYYEGYSIEEIAWITHKKPATIGTHLKRGRAILKDKIGVEMYDR